jgi:L-alanine-DL-glutamate epimerase-like enolase superfamily enzyme
MQRLIDAEAADLFIMKMPRSGGPDRFLEMVTLATAAGIACVNTGPLESAIGTLAGLHVTSLMPQPLAHSGFSLSEHYARDLAAVPPVIGGCRTIPDLPGLGIKPDEDFISAMTDPTSTATCRSRNNNPPAPD